MCVDTCTSLERGAALQCLYRGAEERAGAHRCGRYYTTPSLLLHALDPSPPSPSQTAALPCKKQTDTTCCARCAVHDLDNRPTLRGRSSMHSHALVRPHSSGSPRNGVVGRKHMVEQGAHTRNAIVKLLWM